MIRWVGVGVLVVRVASAEPYPDQVVDRPLVLPSGVTEVGASEAVQSSTTSTFDGHQFDLFASHGFGPVEVDAVLAFDASLTFNVALPGIPAEVYVGAETGAPQNNGHLFESQSIGAAYKLVVAPELFAATFSAGASVAESRDRDLIGVLRWSNAVFVGPSASGTVQLAPFLALRAAVSFDVPVETHDTTARSELGIDAELIATISNRWDFFATAGLSDLTDTHLPYLVGGLVYRRIPY
jgi:hypothetical protein